MGKRSRSGAATGSSSSAAASAAATAAAAAAAAAVPVCTFQLHWSNPPAYWAVVGYPGAFEHDPSDAQREAHKAATAAAAASGGAKPPPLRAPAAAAKDIDFEPRIVHGLRVWRTQEGRVWGQRSVTLHGATPEELQDRARLLFLPRGEGGGPSYAEESLLTAPPAVPVPAGALSHAFTGPAEDFGALEAARAKVQLRVRLAVARAVGDFWGADDRSFYKFSVASTNSLQPRYKGSLTNISSDTDTDTFFGLRSYSSSEKKQTREKREQRKTLFLLNALGVQAMLKNSMYSLQPWQGGLPLLVSAADAHVDSISGAHVAVIAQYLDTVLR
jgi:hypothetical protein